MDAILKYDATYLCGDGKRADRRLEPTVILLGLRVWGFGSEFRVLVPGLGFIELWFKVNGLGKPPNPNETL